MTTHSTSVSNTDTNTVRLTEQKQVDIIQVLGTQDVAGWITSTQTESHGTINYGPFPTSEEAYSWAQNLINAVVEPVYIPAFNRG